MAYSRIPTQKPKKKKKSLIFLILLGAFIIVGAVIILQGNEAFAPRDEETAAPEKDKTEVEEKKQSTDELPTLNGEGEEPGGGVDEPYPDQEPEPEPEPKPESETITYDPDNVDVDYLIDKLDFLENPMPGTFLTDQASQLPNAPRPYRSGTHEGLDFYPGAAGNISMDDPIQAAASGEIVRIDHDYEKPTKEKLRELSDKCHDLGKTPEDILDTFRGRQVWVEHDKGFIIRYCHLEDVNEALEKGQEIDKETQIGTMGYSGTTSPEHPHLHLEIRFGDHYLGEGMSEAEIRKFFEDTIFSN